jgi:hypothetical protein
MILGGGDPAIKAAHVIDLNATPKKYVATGSLHEARMHVNAVILPDRTVVATGGSGAGEDPTAAALHAEIYDAASGNWTLGAKASVPRLYHSVALLLPDARVITAGSNPHRRDDELRLELYHPPYLFKGPPPFIESAPQHIAYGETFEIHTPHPLGAADPADGDHAFRRHRAAARRPADRGADLLPPPRTRAARTEHRAARMVHALHHRPKRRPVARNMGASAAGPAATRGRGQAAAWCAAALRCPSAAGEDKRPADPARARGVAPSKKEATGQGHTGLRCAGARWHRPAEAGASWPRQ